MATAPTARVTSVVGHTRSSMRVLSAAISSAQPPTAPGDAHALLELAFLADDAADARRLRGPARADRQDVVEGVGDLPLHADQIGRHARREVAVPEPQQRHQQLARERRRPTCHSSPSRGRPARGRSPRSGGRRARPPPGRAHWVARSIAARRRRSLASLLGDCGSHPECPTSLTPARPNAKDGADLGRACVRSEAASRRDHFNASSEQ